MTSKIAVIRVRGLTGVRKGVKDTLEMLGLRRKNHCVVLEDTANFRGMVNKAKDYITWGNINEETLEILTEKKGDGKVFRLSPPLKGFGRKGIKVPFSKRGALGDRGDKINDLIRRMVGSNEV